jgi:formylglycine-generating enzyme required for sulfatase activity
MGDRPPPSAIRRARAVVASALTTLAVACGGRATVEPAPAPLAPARAAEPATLSSASVAAPLPEPSASASAPVVEPASPCGAPVPGMACIPAGEFVRGADDGDPNERPQSKIDLDAFFMDVTEVTVEAHDACVASGRCKAVHTIYPDFSRPKQPKVGVSWYDADAYCKAMHKHLPTEAEWEKAARGTDGRRYPWGDEPATCERAIIKTEAGRSCGVKQASGEPDKGRTFEVASRAPNPYGLYDMAGNAWEWVADYYSKSYAECGEACSGKNPKGPCDGAIPCPRHVDRVVRGGSWYWDASYATTTLRHHHVPSNNPYHHYGFRCAASLEEAAALRGAGR